RGGAPAGARRPATAPKRRAILSGRGDDHLRIGYEAMGRLLALDRRPDGLFCTSDLIAFGAHRRALEAGVETPRDLVIVGFDDSPLNDWVAPWLTSVRVPYDSFGPAIARTIAGPPDADAAADIILPHLLVARGGAIDAHDHE
ncbi:MAG: substrate-binding domain-containing protein, partial [Alphaproteobacteria bacterium]